MFSGHVAVARACIRSDDAFLSRLEHGCKQLYTSPCEERFVRTFDLQKGFSLSEAVNDGWERNGFGSEDLKSGGAPLPLEQKYTLGIRTGNRSLTKRNALTTEPSMQI